MEESVVIDNSATDIHTEQSVVTYVDTLLGPVWIMGTERGICNLGFGQVVKSNEMTRMLRRGIAEPQEVVRSHPLLSKAVAQIEAYFDARLRVFSLDLDLRGTAFQLSVWDRIQQIPYAETISYGEIATYLGRPNASQAVGQATGANPVSIVIPCHRVVGHDNRLTGYGGGIERKAALLEMEQAGMQLRMRLG